MLDEREEGRKDLVVREVEGDSTLVSDSAVDTGRRIIERSYIKV